MCVQDDCEGEEGTSCRRYIPPLWSSPHLIRRLTPTLGRKYQHNVNSTFIIRKVNNIIDVN